MHNQTINEGKNIAIISYLFWLGLIIAIFINNNNKNPFTSFHIRQSFGILIINLFSGLAYRFFHPLLGSILGVVSLILLILGIISAYNGEEKEVPFVGSLFQDIFKGIS
jgi:uncharacterized membrane protein